MNHVEKKRLVVAVSGASGSLLALDLLRQLRTSGRWETHVIVSRGGQVTLEHEIPKNREEFLALADVYHKNEDIGASVAGGSYKTEGMVVVPCSMKTLAGIAGGYADTLLLRAADVTIKERRPLVLVARETPLSPIHLRNMAELAAMGVIILPPVMGFYHHPRSVEDLVRQITGRIMCIFGEEAEGYTRWSG